MKNKSVTLARNAKVVGNNSKSYNDKHPENPIPMRPIYNAIQNTPKILDMKHRFVLDVKKIQLLRSFANLPRQQLSREISLC